MNGDDSLLLHLDHQRTEWGRLMHIEVTRISDDVFSLSIEEEHFLEIKIMTPNDLGVFFRNFPCRGGVLDFIETSTPGNALQIFSHKENRHREQTSVTLRVTCKAEEMFLAPLDGPPRSGVVHSLVSPRDSTR